MKSFNLVPQLRPELVGFRREEESLVIGFYGVPARERLFQAAGKQEEELAIATDH